MTGLLTYVESRSRNRWGGTVRQIRERDGPVVATLTAQPRPVSGPCWWSVRVGRDSIAAPGLRRARQLAWTLLMHAEARSNR